MPTSRCYFSFMGETFSCSRSVLDGLHEHVEKHNWLPDVSTVPGVRKIKKAPYDRRVEFIEPDRRRHQQ